MDAMTISVEAERSWLMIVKQLMVLSVDLRQRDLWAPTKKARRP